MSLNLAPGTIVLNQDPDHPMYGEIVEPPEGELTWANHFYVKWPSGLITLEDAKDLTLTAQIVLR